VRNPLKRDNPPRAALVVAAFALLASVVAGGEKSVPSGVIEPREAATPVVSEPIDLDPARLVRPRREGEIPDLFAGRQVAPPLAPAAIAPPTPVKPAPPPPPSAPPLPFKYLGRYLDGDRLVVFLARNEEAFSVTAGEKLDNGYEVEAITEESVSFVYLPLGTKQVLTVPPPQ
jgi:hypothetical protein